MYQNIDEIPSDNMKKRATIETFTVISRVRRCGKNNSLTEYIIL